jgi:hypothetical protein
MILHSQKANLHSQIANSEPLIQTLLNSHVPLWAQQHMVDRHYSLNFKPWSARTLYVYAQADLAQQYSIGLQEICGSRLSKTRSAFGNADLSTSQVYKS